MSSKHELSSSAPPPCPSTHTTNANVAKESKDQHAAHSVGTNGINAGLNHSIHSCAPIRNGDEVAKAREDTRYAAAVHNSRSRLLTLPAEIRNGIYEHCVENKCIHLYPTPGHPGTRIRREYDGLAQVSQLVRVEFRPLYYEKTEMWVPVPFLRYFVSEHLHGKSPNANLIVDIQDQFSFNNPKADILPLMTLSNTAPYLHFRFGHRSDDNLGYGQDVVAEELTVLFAKTDTRGQLWKQFLQEAVTKIIVEEFWKETIVSIVVNPQHHPNWPDTWLMPGWYARDYDMVMRKWMNKVGFPKTNMRASIQILTEAEYGEENLRSWDLLD